MFGSGGSDPFGNHAQRNPNSGFGGQFGGSGGSDPSSGFPNAKSSGFGNTSNFGGPVFGNNNFLAQTNRSAGSDGSLRNSNPFASSTTQSVNPFAQTTGDFQSNSRPNAAVGFGQQGFSGHGTRSSKSGMGGTPFSNGFGSSSAESGNTGPSFNAGPRGRVPVGSKPQPTCRVCQTSFDSFDSLKKHIKAEKHFDTPSLHPSAVGADTGFQSPGPAVKSFAAGAATTGLSAGAAVFTPQAAMRQKANSPPKRVMKKQTPFSVSAPPVSAVSGNSATALIGGRVNPFKQPAAAPVFCEKAASSAPANQDFTFQNQEDDDVATVEVDDDEEEEEEEEDDQGNGQDLEYIPSESDNNNLSDDDEQDEIDEDDVNVSTDSVVGDQILSSSSSTRAGTQYGLLTAPHNAAHSSSINTLSSSEGEFIPAMKPITRPEVKRSMQVAAPYVDTSKALSTCEDMCPEEERTKRVNESDVHKLELPYGNASLPDLMVKKFQRSSADHELQIAHLLRTPKALLKSIRYIENYIMNKANEGFDPRCNEVPTNLFVYLFVWDRYRMIAKDFTLQQSAVALSSVWVECAERMARWFILMDHKMQGNDDYVGGHAQQNGEQLNNLLKTLHGYYFRARTFKTDSSAADSLHMPNKAEFVGYFIIFQLGNGGEVSKYLQQLPEDILNSEPIKFTLLIWSSLKTENYAAFFKLLKKASILQACLMHRYVGEVRMLAIRKIVKTFCIPNARGPPSVEFSLTDIIRWLCFEGTSDAVEFVDHCGLEWRTTPECGLDPEEVDLDTVSSDDITVHFENQNIDNLLPRDKNGHPIMPRTSFMKVQIDETKSINPATGAAYSIADIARGYATGAVLFNDLEYLSVSSDAQLFPNLPPLSSAHIASSASAINSTIEQRLKDKIRKKTVPSVVSAPPPPPPVATAVTAPFPESTAPTSGPFSASKPDRSALLSGSLGSSRGTKVTPPKDKVTSATVAANVELDIYYSRTTPPPPVVKQPSAASMVNYGPSIPKYSGTHVAPPSSASDVGSNKASWCEAKPVVVSDAPRLSASGGFASALESFKSGGSGTVVPAPPSSTSVLFPSSLGTEGIQKGRQQKPEKEATTTPTTIFGILGSSVGSQWSSPAAAGGSQVSWVTGGPAAQPTQPQAVVNPLRVAPIVVSVPLPVQEAPVALPAAQQFPAESRHSSSELNSIEQQIRHRFELRRTAQCLAVWKQFIQSSALIIRANVLKRRLRQWRTACDIIQTQRQQLLDAMQVIDSHALSSESFMSRGSVKRMRDRSEDALRLSVSNADKFKPHCMLVDALDKLESGAKTTYRGRGGAVSFRQYFTAGRVSTTGESLLAADLLPLLAKVMQLSQNNHIAVALSRPSIVPSSVESGDLAHYLDFIEKMGGSVLDASTGPAWQGSLFLNVAVLSPSSIAHVWSDYKADSQGDCFLVNMFRMLLASLKQQSSGRLTKNQLHKQSKQREAQCVALVKAARSATMEKTNNTIGLHSCPIESSKGRSFNLSVSDLCMHSSASHKKNEQLQDTQGVVILLDCDLALGNGKGGSVGELLKVPLVQLRDCVSNCLPFVLILTETIASNGPSLVKFTEVTAADCNSKWMSVVATLNTLLHKTLNLPLALCDFQHLLVSSYLLTVTISAPSNTLSLNNWFSVFKTSEEQTLLLRQCYACISFALCDLARHARPLPLLRGYSMTQLLGCFLHPSHSSICIQGRADTSFLSVFREVMGKVIQNFNCELDKCCSEIRTRLAGSEVSFPQFPAAIFADSANGVKGALWRDDCDMSLPVNWTKLSQSAEKSLSHYLFLLALPEWLPVNVGLHDSVVDVVQAECTQYQNLLLNFLQNRRRIGETPLFAVGFAITVMRLLDCRGLSDISWLVQAVHLLFQQIMRERFDCLKDAIDKDVPVLYLPEKFDNENHLTRRVVRAVQQRQELVEPKEVFLSRIVDRGFVVAVRPAVSNTPKRMLKRSLGAGGSTELQQPHQWRDFMKFNEENHSFGEDYNKRVRMNEDHEGDEVSDEERAVAGLEEQLEAIRAVNSILAEETYTSNRLNDYLKGELLTGGWSSTHSGLGRAAKKSSVSIAGPGVDTVPDDPFAFIEMCRAEREDMQNRLHGIVGNRAYQ